MIFLKILKKTTEERPQSEGFVRAGCGFSAPHFSVVPKHSEGLFFDSPGNCRAGQRNPVQTPGLQAENGGKSLICIPKRYDFHRSSTAFPQEFHRQSTMKSTQDIQKILLILYRIIGIMSAGRLRAEAHPADGSVLPPRTRARTDQGLTERSVCVITVSLRIIQIRAVTAPDLFG